MKTSRTTLLTAFVLTLFLASPLLTAEDGAAGPVDFTLEQLGGGPVALSDFRGDWVVVNYWATWCAPCVKEMPELSDLHEERDGLVVLGLAFEDVDDEDFYEFLEDNPVSYPILKVDVYEPPQPFGSPKVLPTTYVLDAQGVPVKTFLGPVTREDIERFIHGQEPM
jgi:thiol-disulfide isomerase/thioredoxin